MAISFDAPASADFALKEFAARGEENPDGWGLAWYPDQSLAMVKEPSKWASSRLAGFLESDPTIRGRTFLAHVRHKTMGGAPSHADTHPFHREMGGRDYCFAHNGTVDGPAWELPLGRFQPLGATDSERFFCHLLAEIEARSEHLNKPDDWRWLYARLAAANEFGKLNVLFSDGVRLFIYHDANGWKGLSFQDLRPERGNGILIATYPLDKAYWHPFKLGELIVFEAGQVRFSSHREIASADFPPTLTDRSDSGWHALKTL